MNIDEIKKIPQILENPILILKSQNTGRDDGDNTRLVIFGNIKAKDGRPILSVLDLRPVENNLAVNDMQKVSSAYTKDTNPIEFIKNSLVVYADKKRTTKLLRTIGFYAPIELQLSGYIGSIAYLGQNVNIEGKEFSKVFQEVSELNSDRDSTSRELSKEQQDVRFSDRDDGNSGRNFSYDDLIAKNDLEGFIIDKTKQVKLTSNGSIDENWIVSEVKKKCNVQKINSNVMVYYTNVPDIDKNVEITKKGVVHSFFKSVGRTKKASPRDLINARVSLELPNILKNSIEVNRSLRTGNLDVPFSYIMIGTVGLEGANGNIEYFAVRSVIEERINQNPILAEAKILGKLYAINAKKVGTPNARVVNNNVALTYDVAYKYNVAQFLEDVKMEFDDTFSKDVYQRLGMTRIKNEFSDNLLFSDRDDGEENINSKSDRKIGSLEGDIGYSDRDYSYENLVSKPDMELTVLDSNVPNNRADIVTDCSFLKKAKRGP